MLKLFRIHFLFLLYYIKKYFNILKSRQKLSKFHWHVLFYLPDFAFDFTLDSVGKRDVIFELKTKLIFTDRLS